jgi:hypothetical protein
MRWQDSRRSSASDVQPGGPLVLVRNFLVISEYVVWLSSVASA